MDAKTLWRWFWVANLVAFFALACWFRVTSLKTAPEPQADEDIYGALASQWVAGERISMVTPSGRYYNPIYLAATILLRKVCTPSYTMLRAPAAFFGILTLLLTYRLGRRVLDRPTALIASGVLAALPIAIIYSRIGWESSLTPLIGLLAIVCAYQGRVVGLSLAILYGYFTQPTTILIAPIVLPLLARHALRPDAEGKRAWRWGVVKVGAVLSLFLGLALEGRRNADHPAIVHLREHLELGHRDWPRFLTGLKELLLGMFYYHDMPDWLFYGPLAVLVVVGGVRLWRLRQWDRLILVGGMLVSLFAFGWAAGVGGVHQGLAR